MNKTFLPYLCCGRCKNEIKLKGNRLECLRCNTSFEIRKGIPILIDLDKLSPHLRGQIKYFRNENTGEYILTDWQKSYLKRLEENFNLGKGELLIDCGTGSGYIALEMAKRGLKVIACDLTLNSLFKLQSTARRYKLENNLFVLCCNIEELPFKTKIADYLTLNAVLEHVEDETQVIKEIIRITGKKAGLMVTVPLKFRFVNPLLILLNYIHDKRIGHLRRYDLESLTYKFKGWKIVNTYYTGHFFKVIKVIVNMFFRVFNDRDIELEDRQRERQVYGASNICMFLKKEMR